MWFCIFFFFNDTATTEIYTLSLHDALPILFDQLRPLARQHEPGVKNAVERCPGSRHRASCRPDDLVHRSAVQLRGQHRSEEHTSELQSRQYLVCRLLLEKKIMII